MKKDKDQVWVYSQHCAQAGMVVIARMMSMVDEEPDSPDYMVVDRETARRWSRIEVKNSDDMFYWRAGNNTLRYLGEE